MVKNIINNLPNIKNKTQFEEFVLPNREGFENYISSIYNSTLQSSEMTETTYDKQDAELVEEKNENGEKQISVLSAIVSTEKPIPKKIPDEQGIKQDSQIINEVDIKSNNFDKLLIRILELMIFSGDVFFIFKSN